MVVMDTPAPNQPSCIDCVVPQEMMNGKISSHSTVLLPAPAKHHCLSPISSCLWMATNSAWTCARMPMKMLARYIKTPLRSQEHPGRDEATEHQRHACTHSNVCISISCSAGVHVEVRHGCFEATYLAQLHVIPLLVNQVTQYYRLGHAWFSTTCLYWCFLSYTVHARTLAKR